MDRDLSSSIRGPIEYVVDISHDGLEAYLMLNIRSTGEGSPESVKRPSPADVVEVLHEHGVRHGLQQDVIRSLCDGTLSGRQLVARGSPPVGGKDGWIELLFPIPDRRAYDDSTERIDYFERDEVTRVEAGTPIARLHPPQDGIPGSTVTGDPILPPPPEEFKIKILEGATLADDRQTIVATQDGRPIYEHGVIHVGNVLEIDGNVDLKCGNVRYRGSVIVTGDVHEKLLVDAKGLVVIRGNVAKARVYSETGIRVGGQVVGSELVVRGLGDLAQESADTVQKIVTELTNLLSVSKLVTDRLPKKGSGKTSLGPVISFLAGKKFPGLFPRIEELRARLGDKQAESIVDREETLRIVDNLTKGGLKNLATLSELRQRIDELETLEKVLRTRAADHGHFVGTYAHVCDIHVSGDAHFQGRGAYHTNVEAGHLVVVEGVFRGGTARAGKGVYVREVGSQVEVETVIRLNDDGFLRAGVIHPGVVVHIGPRVWKAFKQWRNVEVRLSQNGTIETAGLRRWNPPTPSIKV